MEFTLTTPIFLVTALAIAVWLGLRARLEPGHFAAVLIFTVYLVGVAHFVILPLRADPDLAQAVGAPDISRLLEFTPFFFPGGVPLSPDQLLLNVLVTVPFGFGLPFVASFSLRMVVLIGFLFSLGIELAQLVADVTQLAMPTWSIDINDVMLNSLGVVVGVVAFVAVGTLYRAILGRLSANGLGPWAHFHRTLVDGRSPRQPVAIAR